MMLDTKSRIAFILKYKNATYQVRVDKILYEMSNEIVFSGKYWVEIHDGKNEYFVVYKLDSGTRQYHSYFNVSLHHDVIKSIGQEIAKRGLS